MQILYRCSVIINSCTFSQSVSQCTLFTQHQHAIHRDSQPFLFVNRSYLALSFKCSLQMLQQNLIYTSYDRTMAQGSGSLARGSAFSSTSSLLTPSIQKHNLNIVKQLGYLFMLLLRHYKKKERKKERCDCSVQPNQGIMADFYLTAFCFNPWPLEIRHSWYSLPHETKTH